MEILKFGPSVSSVSQIQSDFTLMIRSIFNQKPKIILQACTAYATFTFFEPLRCFTNLDYPVCLCVNTLGLHLY
jgi:hypothetical protein